MVDHDPVAVAHIARGFDEFQRLLPGNMTHAQRQVVRLAGFEDFITARNQLALVIEEKIVGILEFGVALVVRLDAGAEAFALDVVARAPRR